MSYHHQNKNRNAENASYMHVQRDSVRTVTLNAPPRSRPTTGSYNKADVNKEPKLNLCPGEGFYWCGSLLTALGLSVDSWSLLLPLTAVLNTNQRTASRKSQAHDLKDMEQYSCLNADELAVHLLRDLPPCTVLCSPWVVSFHAGGLFLRGWHFLVPLSARFNYVCQITTLSFPEDIMITFLKGLVWGLTAIFLTTSLPPCPSKSFHLAIGKGMVYVRKYTATGENFFFFQL